MATPQQFHRRTIVKMAGAGAVAVLGAPLARANAEEKPAVRGNIKQSLCRWCYAKVPLGKLAEEAKRIGYRSIELLTPKQFEEIKPYGLTCAMLTGACKIEDCFNRRENHAELQRKMSELIEFAGANSLPNVICFSGNRRGMPDDEGLENCAEGIKPLIPLAEKNKVTICMELLNSKLNHKDYMCDRTAWGVALAQRIGSERFKLLYDIYHMQIMEGDVIRTIRDNGQYIAHYHTGGNPGRHEIDETQELYYPAIVRAIIETGYDGYLGQEFIPTREPLASLEQGFRICDV